MESEAAEANGPDAAATTSIPSTKPEEHPEPVVKLTKAQKKLVYGCPEHIKSWRELIKSLVASYESSDWTEEEKAEGRQIAIDALHQIFAQGAEGFTNPYANAFDLAISYSQSLESTGVFVLDEFKKWLNKQGTESELFEKHVNAEMQLRVLKKGSERSATYLAKISTIFNLDDPRMIDAVKANIREMCTSEAKHCFKEALDLAAMFKLHDEFEFELFLEPNIVLDRLECVERYVRGNDRLSRQFIRYLDDFVNRDDSWLLNKLAPLIERKIATQQALIKLKGKAVEKVVRRSIAHLGLSEDLGVRTKSMVITGNIRYKIGTREGTGQLTPVIFDDIKASAGFDRRNQVYAVEQCVLAGHLAEAAMWFMFFELTNRDIRQTLLEKFRTPSNWKEGKEMLEKFAQSSTSVQRQLYLTGGEGEEGPSVPIVWVDTWAAVEEMLDEIEKDEDQLIGIDSEFQPSSVSTKQIVAILQISTFSKAYILDFYKFQNILTQRQFETLVKRLLGGEHYKLGFDMDSDLGALANSFPAPDNVYTSNTHVICLKKLVNEILNENSNCIDMSALPSSQERARPAGNEEAILSGSRAFRLADLSFVLLNHEISKTEQQSNWNVRPLRPEQLMYAARDAYVLLAIYGQLRARAEAAGLDFDDLVDRCEKLQAESKEEKKERKKETKADALDELYKEAEELGLIAPATSGRDKTFVVDSTHQGMGKYLRRMGVDVLFVDSTELSDVALSCPDRIFVSCGKTYTENAALFVDRAYFISNTNTGKDQARVLLRAAKPRVYPYHVIRKCIHCNSGAIVVAPRLIMLALHERASKNEDEYDFADTFDEAKWETKIRDDPTLEVMEGDGFFMVQCIGGNIEMRSNCVIAAESSDPLQIAVIKVQKDIILENDHLFICGECGKISYPKVTWK